MEREQTNEASLDTVALDLPPTTATATTTSDQPSLSKKGIDIGQALSILADRSSSSNHGHHNEHDHHPGNDSKSSGGGCCQHGAPEHAKSMGQTIDLFAAAASSVDDGSANANLTVQEQQQLQQEQQQQMQEQREARKAKILAQLQSLNNVELLQALFQAQEDRVAAYREYERGCQQVLQTGNMTYYPDCCAKVTAAFSVLSETIKTIQDILKSHNNKTVWVDWIQQLQELEKEKLYLTAAHHLERIREKNQLEEEMAAQSEKEADPRISQLLSKGVASLTQKIATCIEKINDILDELRCCMLEEQSES